MRYQQCLPKPSMRARSLWSSELCPFLNLTDVTVTLTTRSDSTKDKTVLLDPHRNSSHQGRTHPDCTLD